MRQCATQGQPYTGLIHGEIHAKKLEKKVKKGRRQQGNYGDDRCWLLLHFHTRKVPSIKRQSQDAWTLRLTLPFWWWWWRLVCRLWLWLRGGCVCRCWRVYSRRPLLCIYWNSLEMFTEQKVEWDMEGGRGNKDRWWLRYYGSSRSEIVEASRNSQGACFWEIIRLLFFTQSVQKLVRNPLRTERFRWEDRFWQCDTRRRRGGKLDRFLFTV